MSKKDICKSDCENYSKSNFQFSSLNLFSKPFKYMFNLRWILKFHLWLNGIIFLSEA